MSAPAAPSILKREDTSWKKAIINQDLSFRQFGLGEPLLRTIDEVGYETPTPIQVHTIPRCWPDGT